MGKFTKECFGTKLIISLDKGILQDSDIQLLHSTIDTFEQKYSRFIPGNFLDTLNQNKEALLDKELSSILNLALKVSKITEGYFDISVLPLLENIGYGTGKTYKDPKVGYKNIELTDTKIILHNDVSIEIGGVGKGYMVDTLYNILNKNHDTFVINFGGDIRVKGKQVLYLEDPLDDTKYIGEITITNASLAGSNSNKRMTKKGTHLINPFANRKVDQKKTIFTTHKLSSFSDIFATALWVSPLEMSINILEKTQGLEGLIIAENGEIYKSKGFEAELYM